ncbi:MAG: dicarboxylate/amino acid:cation symporter [Longimicrobiales bacterium]
MTGSDVGSNAGTPNRSVNHVGLALGLLAGLAFGLLAAATGNPLLLDLAEGVRPLGTAFVNALQMVVIPLVVSVIFVGVARLGDPRKVGRLGGLSVAFFWTTTILAIVIGMASMALLMRFAPEVAAPAVEAQTRPELPGIVDFLLSLIPRNPFAAATNGALLPLIVFSVLLGAAVGTLPERQRHQLVEVADALTEALITLVFWILWTGPVGLFALAAPITAELGWAMLGSLAVFVIAVVLGLFLFMGAVYIPAAAVLGRRSPGQFLKGAAGAYAVGFSTGSSVASLPVMLTDADKKLGVNHQVGNLVLPLAASLNRAGSALYQGAAVVFLASLYDVNIPTSALVGSILATFLVSLTVAPVPSASVMTLAPALDTVGVPLAGLAVLLGIDRIPDMFRTGTNVLGHMTTAVVVDGLTQDPRGRGDPTG